MLQHVLTEIAYICGESACSHCAFDDESRIMVVSSTRTLTSTDICLLKLLRRSHRGIVLLVLKRHAFY